VCSLTKKPTVVFTLALKVLNDLQLAGTPPLGSNGDLNQGQQLRGVVENHRALPRRSFTATLFGRLLRSAPNVARRLQQGSFKLWHEIVQCTPTSPYVHPQDIHPVSPEAG
jgi:hypothetical protein